MGLWRGIKDAWEITKEIFLPEPTKVIVLNSRPTVEFVEKEEPNGEEELQGHVGIIAIRVQNELYDSEPMTKSDRLSYISGHLGIGFRDTVLLTNGEPVWIGHRIDCPIIFKGLQFSSLIDNTYVPIITKYFVERLKRIEGHIAVLRVEARSVYEYEPDGYKRPPAYYLRVVYGLGTPLEPVEKSVPKPASKGKKKK